jgi:RNA polymerase sigma factor (sigma-70 family)
MKDQDQLLDLQTTDSFRLYLDEVGRHPLLTKEDEIELSQAYEAGLDAQLKLADTSPDDPARPDLEAVAERGEWARRKMIESNLRLVVSIARRFSATGLPLGDLVQEGNLGLLRAVEKFDWRKGFKFSTYATWWIRQAIARGAADRGARAIRLPVHVDEQVGRLRRTQTQPMRSWRWSWTWPPRRSIGSRTPPRRSPAWTPRSGMTGRRCRTFWRTTRRSGPMSWPWRRSVGRPWSRS